MQREITVPKAVKGYKGCFTGFRTLPEKWAQFRILARNKGLSGNKGLERLLDYALVREFIPEYIPGASLPGYTPPKEEEIMPRQIPNRYVASESVEPPAKTRKTKEKASETTRQ